MEDGPVLEPKPPRRKDKATRKKANHRVLGVMGISAITYFVGCGGPIRSEPVMSAAGPLIGIPALLLYPLLVTVPYAYIVAELCTAFPEDGGFVIWVLNAFGPFWGFQAGYWSWISGVFKDALLPAFFFKILFDYTGTSIGSPVVMYFLKALIAIMLTLPSLLGTVVVERGCFLLLGFVAITTLIFTVWGYATARDYRDLWEMRHKSIVWDDGRNDEIQTGPLAIEWGLFINTLFWAFDGINMASVFGGAVANPAHVYSRAIFITIAMTVATYILPLPAAVITDRPNWTLFKVDSLPFIAFSIGGRTLQCITVLSSLASVTGLYMSGLFCKSFQVSGMAEHAILPRFLGKRNRRFDSPHFSILATLAFTLLLLGVDADDLVPMTNAFAAAVQLLIILAVIQLRRVLPYIPRPTKAPGGIGMLLCIAVLPTVMLCYITFNAMSNWVSACIVFAFLLPGLGYGWHQKAHYQGA